MRTIKARDQRNWDGDSVAQPCWNGPVERRKKVIPTPEQEAKVGCYFMDDGETLAIPGWNLFRAS